MNKRQLAINANRSVLWLSRHWRPLFLLFWGLFVTLPWLAPVLMGLGWTGPARAIYAVYATQCHQLPQRSFFLLGPKVMYSLEEIQAVWPSAGDPLTLRQFIGTPEMGWKVAWSDRMVAMYTSILLFGLLYGWLRKHLRPLPIWAFALLLLPMALDGGTHLLSDFAFGIGQGLRYDNAWLASLTGKALPAAFYVGDAFGSFNSWLRLLTGALFGLGFVWFLFPFAEQGFADTARQIEVKFERRKLRLTQRPDAV